MQNNVTGSLRKIFEENARGTLQEVHDHFNAKTVKGGIVIVVSGKN
jgi:16S rRNA (cytidine1402-2'-O)-methyltransferase